MIWCEPEEQVIRATSFYIQILTKDLYLTMQWETINPVITQVAENPFEFYDHWSISERNIVMKPFRLHPLKKKTQSTSIYTN